MTSDEPATSARDHTAYHDEVSVLVCDDVPELRGLFRLELELEGDIHVVAEAGDGRSAIELVTDLNPEVLLLDLSMPDMDGLEVLVALQTLAPHVQVVVLSGYRFDVMGPRTLECGAYRYLEKGVSGKVLREAVRLAAAESA